ncbi:hypothetical protein SRABI36_03006 [Pedobacter sp. Bi36]|nr:hypothetical protein SRABI36_03006 [Pedobacter sp. Bi36]CAH0268407.1 hypothetical protein SRABI126_03406 [Pedobacter sp. Bi126]
MFSFAKIVLLIEFASKGFFGTLHDRLSNQYNFVFIFELKLLLINGIFDQFCIFKLE